MGGVSDAQEWTLILWDIENVAVPDELRSADRVRELTDLLKTKFAIERGKELYCIKLACHWSHPKAPYSDLLGTLTTLGDVEALSYQWQGHGGDKIHNADRMLRRASDRFMRVFERRGPNAPQHLVVFITSDEDFSEKIAELQSRNFKVEVLYHTPGASTKPVSIINAANKSYDWLTFLKLHLQTPNLTLRYDPSLYHPITRFNRAHAAVNPRRAAVAQPQQQGTAARQPALAAASWRQTQANAASGQSQGSSRQSVPPAAAQPNGLKTAASALPPATPGAVLVAIHGLRDGQIPANKMCSALLARVLGPQVADSITVRVVSGLEGPVATLDFRAMEDPAAQAAAAVRSLQGQHFNDIAITAELCGPAPASGFSGKPSQPMPASASRRATVASATPSRAAAWTNPVQPGTGRGSRAPTFIEQRETISSGTVAGADRPGAVKGKACSVGDTGKEQSELVNESPTEAQISPPANSSIGVAAAETGTPSRAAAAFSPGDVLPCDSEVYWGCENPRDGGTELFHNDTANLEKQYQRLQSLGPADQATSEHRLYKLAVGHDLCTIDLLTMRLSRENGGKAPCEQVWRSM
ncbi:hypothetical protein ABBQ38_008204 [Trebouxia sp. C0009 RCD-2024]